MFGKKNKNEKILNKLAKQQAKFAKKALKYKPTSVKVGDTFINPKSGITYEVISQKVQNDKVTGIKSRTLKIKTNYAPKPNIELPDSLFTTDDLVKMEKSKKKTSAKPRTQRTKAGVKRK